MSAPYCLGIDIGGTQVKTVAVPEEGAALGEFVVSTGDDGSGRWMENAASVVRSAADRFGGRPAWIGVSAPGLAARDGRSIAHLPGRLAGIEGLEWAKRFEMDRPVPVLNDAHAALLGEIWRGAARGARDAVLLTLGTGVGGAVWSGGRLMLGHRGRAGHLGHLSLDPWGERDIVGTPGSIENAIGECTLAARTAGRFTSTRDLVEAAGRGDAAATAAWHRSLDALAAAIVSLVNILDPEVVVIGGGVARAGAALFGPLEERVRAIEWQPAGHRVRIVAAALGELAGAYGAAWHAIREELRCA